MLNESNELENTDSLSKGAEPCDVAQENYSQKSDSPWLTSLCTELERTASVLTVLAGSRMKHRFQEGKWA